MFDLDINLDIATASNFMLYIPQKANRLDYQIVLKHDSYTSHYLYTRSPVIISNIDLIFE